MISVGYVKLDLSAGELDGIGFPYPVPEQHRFFSPGLSEVGGTLHSAAPGLTVFEALFAKPELSEGKHLPVLQDEGVACRIIAAVLASFGIRYRSGVPDVRTALPCATVLAEGAEYAHVVLVLLLVTALIEHDIAAVRQCLDAGIIQIFVSQFRLVEYYGRTPVGFQRTAGSFTGMRVYLLRMTVEFLDGGNWSAPLLRLRHYRQKRDKNSYKLHHQYFILGYALSDSVAGVILSLKPSPSMARRTGT